MTVVEETPPAEAAAVEAVPLAPEVPDVPRRIGGLTRSGVLSLFDASTFGMSALMAAGLALFLLTLAVNFTASSIVARSRSGAQSEA
ncbi:hypothetical protein [Streptomyces cylindrosporus]|uniref:MFS transporter n=1 Tax=Streptomyces cylindrosporus TaxID=2927583 RepID=A0ABS9YC89_9ACTN|nr:hypothetical protein [Streptomyces cylindrosporus]MCI3274857.1 hypothetical protein [Streptomyces cylindrosporus]